MPADTLKRLLTTLRDVTGADATVDHPSMNLEQFFLDVVHAASRDETVPSGAGLAGKPADFLLQ